jgi:tryptophan 2,3-dioxygenase
VTSAVVRSVQIAFKTADGSPYEAGLRMTHLDLQTELQELLGERPLRSITTRTETDRIALAAETGGQPLLDVSPHSNASSTPFIDYLNVDILHTLQQPRSDHPDEMVFICMAHVMEVTFKLLCYDAVRAQHAIRGDAMHEARAILRRMHSATAFLAQTWSVVATITPRGYLAFRDHLGVGSGFESFMYRRLEFLLGNKQPGLLRAHEHVPEVHRALERVLNAPSLYDDAIALLHRRGYAIAEPARRRDWSQPYQSDDSVRSAWRRVYHELAPADELYEFAEALVDLADRFKVWRFRHFVTVERLIGFKPGTGGTSGVGWLRHIVDQNFFPELWEVRTTL